MGGKMYNNSIYKAIQVFIQIVSVDVLHQDVIARSPVLLRQFIQLHYPELETVQSFQAFN
jgi:hypothetical protein